MKLTYVHGSPLRAGAANAIHVVRMCAAFARQGAEVRLLVPAASDAIPASRLREHFGDGADTFAIRELSTVRRGGSIHYAMRAARLCATDRPDVVYTRAIVPAAATSLLGLPTVFEAHVPVRDSGPIALAALRLAERTTALRGVVAISAALADALRRDHPRLRGRLMVAPDGADPPTDVAAPGPRTRGSRGLRVGYIGQLYPGKGMEIIAPLAALRPGDEFHVVGGPADLVQQWSASASSANLRFHGPVAPARIAEMLRTFDVLLAPYQRSVKGRNGRIDIAAWMSPLKIFEYMAAGRPMVASDLPVLREVLSDGANALLCSPDDAGAWALALARLAEDPILGERLAAEALRDLETRYTWDRRAANLLRFCAGAGD